MHSSSSSSTVVAVATPPPHAAPWVHVQKGGHSVAYVFDTTRKIHTTFPDGSELVEEYDAETHRLKLRKRRRPSPTGAVGAWEVVLGEAAQQPGRQQAAAAGGLLMQESSSNPCCVRVDTPGHFTWHIHNLSYPRDVYQVSLSTGDEQQCVVVATSNKKYFKRLPMVEMDQLGLVADASWLSWEHAGSTLTIHYAKPSALLAQELADAKAAAAMRAQEPPTDCRQQ